MYISHQKKPQTQNGQGLAERKKGERANSLPNGHVHIRGNKLLKVDKVIDIRYLCLLFRQDDT